MSHLFFFIILFSLLHIIHTTFFVKIESMYLWEGSESLLCPADVWFKVLWIILYIFNSILQRRGRSFVIILLSAAFICYFFFYFWLEFKKCKKSWILGCGLHFEFIKPGLSPHRLLSALWSKASWFFPDIHLLIALRCRDDARILTSWCHRCRVGVKCRAEINPWCSDSVSGLPVWHRLCYINQNEWTLWGCDNSFI